MKPELDKLLCEKFPLLYKDRRAKPSESPLAFGFEVGNGWFNIIYDLSLKLEILIRHHIETEPHVCSSCFNAEASHSLDSQCKSFKLLHPTASQVKEKFGGLRFYMSLGTTPEMLACIKKAEELSFKTCEVCGNPGHIIDSSWVKVRCEDCEKSGVRVF
jgi:hypothetical protein